MSSYHHGNLSAALVDEGLAQVHDRGAEKVTLRGLAGSVGVSPSAAYQHFGDKDALLAAVGSAGYARLRSAMEEAVSAVRGEDDEAAVQRLLASGTSYVAFAVAEPHLFRLMFGPLCAPPEHVRAGEGPRDCADPAEPTNQGRAAFRVLERCLEDLERRQLLRVPADQALRLLLWATVHGFAVLAVETQLNADVGDRVLEVLRELLVGPGESSPTT
ncbi:TetR/AcrR family transcriptional regulator [Quadrisphaera granulorum]|uniref:TetR/AcrR family transcriptional regulator n=1 Tax=Quadrisphaera granulorum TaxID=317664 RepID=UPI001472CE32|nr:TetR/AcrR family transcriptional regulator [Quadrisphaera granulorum]